MLRKKSCFTLAEVLIVIGVIGVVAAITIPTLINSISPKAKEAQTKTIEARLLDGINRYSAMEDGLSQKHETTYDFLVGLSKYYNLKMQMENIRQEVTDMQIILLIPNLQIISILQFLLVLCLIQLFGLVFKATEHMHTFAV